MHVSEVAPRWIKNIHEFISEGQRYVVKVHHVDREKNQVDVSIKRVSEEEKKRKFEMVQNEKRGSKLLEVALHSAKVTIDLPTAKKEIENYFDDVYTCFKEVNLKGEDALKKLDLPKPLKVKILEIATKNIKKPVVTVDAILTLVCYSSQGIETIKNALKVNDDIEVNYLGAPRYKVSLTAPDYKSGEKKLLTLLEHIKTYAQKNNCDFKFDRE
ncbi:Translation initiation factor 2 subunit alpha [Candidatus Bilamarchaeum dharawalense]|uniref:Translation initiation factor 2 subunit alpha n=1 Tax=Candidatus Bilamarchaeum dharawalense TaxID=2885759 RepID=A0A5E4LRW9_9ARCH|nr:Translation initiation factor 2 subunit alpha [Candidatus Bilamarchaeum dharawalense]